MQQQISGEAVDYITAVPQFIVEWNGERIIKTGSYLPKLSQKDCASVLF